MDFSFSDDQQAMRHTARRFAVEKLAPGYLAREAAGKIGRDLIGEMGELGLIGVDIPEEFGGLGQDCLTAGLVLEEIARGDFNASYVQLLASLNCSILASHADRDLARQVVGEVCAGRRTIALGLTEPGAGSDAANLRLKAEATGDGFILNGEKTSISMATQADEIILFARTGSIEDRARGITAFLVPLTAPGISRGSFDDMGSNAVGRGWINFEDVRVEAHRQVGETGMGFIQVMQGFDFSRALIGLQCIAAAAVSLEEAWSYAVEREAFGQPIAGFQGVSEPLAVGETQLAAARLLCYQTLWKRDNNLPHTAEASMCKWWAPQIAFEIIHQCLQTFGHLGYSRELPLQQRLRDVLGLHIGDGTKQIQKMVISRDRIKAAKNGDFS